MCLSFPRALSDWCQVRSYYSAGLCKRSHKVLFVFNSCYGLRRGWMHELIDTRVTHPQHVAKSKDELLVTGCRAYHLWMSYQHLILMHATDNLYSEKRTGNYGAMLGVVPVTLFHLFFSILSLILHQIFHDANIKDREMPGGREREKNQSASLMTRGCDWNIKRRTDKLEDNTNNIN